MAHGVYTYNTQRTGLQIIGYHSSYCDEDNAIVSSMETINEDQKAQSNNILIL